MTTTVEPSGAHGATGPEAPARVITVSGLTTRLATEQGDVTAVEDIDFHVDAGEVLGIVGESGCGKSVTAESVMRLLDEKTTDYSGTVEFDGTDLLSVSEARMRQYRGGRIAMIFQDPMSSLNPVFTVGQQLIETILIHQPMSKEAAKQHAIDALEQTGIADPHARIDDYPHQLSGGMRQRVMIAMALICEPALLIADEPTTALDVTTQAQILRLIDDLRRAHDMATILITHDLGVVADVCDRVMVMYLGEAVEAGPVRDILDNPQHPYTRGLLASTPGVDTDRRQPLPTIPGRVPTLYDVPAGCRFAARCPFAEDACRENRQQLTEIAPGRSVRCWKAVDGLIGAEADMLHDAAEPSRAGRGAQGGER